MAAGKLEALLEAGARVTVVAPDVRPEIARPGVDVITRAFEEADLDGAWWVIAAAPPVVNRRVLEAAVARRIFVNAVDDPDHATAYAGGVVRRDGVTVAISTDGRAPALAGLLREALDAWLPGDLGAWMAAADDVRRAWKRQGVPMEQRRPELLETLNRLYEARASNTQRPSANAPLSTPDARPRSGVWELGLGRWESTGLISGRVSLVGAGPGDPELWTVGAMRRLAEADLVLYDALVDVEALRRATSAQCFCVGKRARRDSVSQETISRLMVRAARRGKRVVRLKGGDPFVFGRGAEEALALALAGIPFEVVPGVTTAVAAPELAGIPVTHRGVASGFLVLAGHTSEAVDHALQSVRPKTMSLVIMMGVAARADLAARLMAHGWPPDTPAAIVCGASTSDAWTWTGRLSEMGGAAAPAGAAGVLVIGDVVQVRDALQEACAHGRGDASVAPTAQVYNEVRYGGH